MRKRLCFQRLHAQFHAPVRAYTNIRGTSRKVESWRRADGTPCLINPINGARPPQRHQHGLESKPYTWEHHVYRPKSPAVYSKGFKRRCHPRAEQLHSPHCFKLLVPKRDSGHLAEESAFR